MDLDSVESTATTLPNPAVRSLTPESGTTGPDARSVQRSVTYGEEEAATPIRGSRRPRPHLSTRPIQITLPTGLLTWVVATIFNHWTVVE